VVLGISSSTSFVYSLKLPGTEAQDNII